MQEKKSILEEALLDIKNIQSALNANTKEILRSVAREEIDSVVKESLVKEIYEEEDLETDDSVDLGGDADAASADIEVMGGEDDSELGGLDDIEGSEEVAPEMEPEMGMNADALGGDEMDMTAASDDDVIAIYKKLSGEDEIEIVGDEIHLNISEPGEYVVKPNETQPAMDLDTEPEMDVDMDMEMGMEPEMGDEDGVDYEIEMGDEDSEESEEAPVGGEEEEEEGEEFETPEGGEEEEEEEETIDEKISIGTGMSVGNHRNPSTGGSIGAAENPKSNLNEAARAIVSKTAKKYNTLLTEAKKLKGENVEFREALKTFRGKLVETVLFNSNLTYVTKLFMEFSTTKNEKQRIMERFDNEVASLKDSKRLYKSIANELGERKPITESLEKKIIKEVNTGSSKQLTETTAYVDPSTQRIKDLIDRVENKNK